MEKIIEKFIEKLSADFVIKKGGQALSIVVSSILPTVILFYLWDEHIYYDKELIRTIILCPDFLAGRTETFQENIPQCNLANI